MKWAERLAGWGLLAGLAALFVLRLIWVNAHVAELRPVGGGDRAPNYTLPLLQGGEVHLGATGAVTVLDFWATWCAPCREELPEVNALWRSVHERGVRVVAVNIEGPGVLPAVRRLVDEAHLELPIALNGDEAASGYRVTNLPHLVVVDATGKIRQVLLGTHDRAELTRAVDAAMR